MEDSADHKEKTIVRRARPEEDAQIAELLIDSFISTYAKKMPEVVVSEKRKEDLRNIAPKREAGCVLVAECKGIIVGTVSLLPFGHPFSDAWSEDSSCLRYMAVDSKYQGRKISTLLIDECVRVAKEWGNKAIELHVRRGAHGVGHLYERYGFGRDPKGDLDLLPEIFLNAYRLVL